MAAPKLPLVSGKVLGGVEDVVVKKGRWGFVQFFFVLCVALCVLLYAPRVLVLAPYADIVFFAPNSSSPSSIAGTTSPVQQQKHVSNTSTTAADNQDHQAVPILDNQVQSPCASMRRDTICCDRSSVHTDVCFMSGEVRTDPASLSLLLFTNASTPPAAAPAPAEERVRPYPRKWERFIMDRVEEVRLRVARPEEEEEERRRCDVRHDAPLLVMSAGGYTGNLFHAFNDGFLPAWVTSQHLRRRVVLGVLAYNPWWAGRFGEVVSGLSEHRVVDLLHDTRTHCFTGGAIVGTRYHGILVVDPARLRDGRTVVDFHRMLAGSYANAPTQQQQQKARKKRRPRLGIVSRKGTRVIENEAAVARLARSVGFEVEVLKTANGAPLSAWHAAVSGCDALVGVHGADLTTFLFLRPGRASLAQIAPLGVSPIARDCFGGPAAAMGVRYEQYDVGANESSLARTRAPDDVVLTDPEAAKRAGGWDLVARVYLGSQNVTLDLARFRHTLARLHAHALSVMPQQEQRR